MSELDVFGVGKVATALSELADPLKEILIKLLGPASEEAGQLLADRVRISRYNNWRRIAEKSNNKLNGLDPSDFQPVSIKVLLPVVEEGSLEEDENLQDKWATLLASAIIGAEIHPKIPKILSELSPIEARILDHLYPFCVEDSLLRRERISITKGEIYFDSKEKLEARGEEIYQRKKVLKQELSLVEVRKKFSLDLRETYFCIENLIKLGVCYYPEVITSTEVITSAEVDEDGDLNIDTDEIEKIEVDESTVYLTMLGIRFLEICKGGEWN